MTQLSGALASGGHLVSSSPCPNVVQVGRAFLCLSDCNSSGLCAELAIFRNYDDVRPTLDAVNIRNNPKKIPEPSINSAGTLHMEMLLSMIGATDTNILDTLSWFDKYAVDADYWVPRISRPNA